MSKICGASELVILIPFNTILLRKRPLQLPGRALAFLRWCNITSRLPMKENKLPLRKRRREENSIEATLIHCFSFSSYCAEQK